MGILDWLTGIGSDGAGTTPTAAFGMDPSMPSSGSMTPPADGAPPQAAPMPQPTQSMPPPQGLDANGPSPVQMTGQDAPQLPPGQQGASSGPPVPMPQPRPAAADLPPNAAPTQGVGAPGPGAAPAGPPMNIAPQGLPPQGATPAPASANGGNNNFSLTRALGLNLSDAQRGALGAGLKSVGDNSSKPGLAAFSGSLGAGMQGATATADKKTDQRIKFLQQAVAAQSAGDKAEYNKNYAAYLTGKLKNDQDTAAAKGNTKSGAWNKPDSQKFIDAQHALAADPEIRASQKLLEQTAKSGEPADIAKATAAHNALIQQKQGMYLQGVGLDPKKAMAQAQNPPGTQANPHVVTSKDDFDAYVKPGDAFVNPKDGKVYIRKGGQVNGGDSPSGGGAAPSAPVSPGPAPGSKDDDD